jgi:hypothetical protein
MNKFYVGYKGFSNGVNHAHIYRASIEPTQENHPDNDKLCWGGFSTAKIAENCAGYQGYTVENSRPYPIWK